MLLVPLNSNDICIKEEVQKIRDTFLKHPFLFIYLQFLEVLSERRAVYHTRLQMETYIVVVALPVGVTIVLFSISDRLGGACV